MAKRIVGFTPEHAKRLADAAHQVERLLAGIAAAEPGGPPREPTPGVWIFSNADEPVPPGGLMAVIDVYHDPATGNTLLQVDQPDTTLHTTYLVAGPQEIPPGEPWFLPLEGEVLAQHDPDWTPEPGQCGGPKPDSWFLHQGYPACVEVLGVRDAESHIVSGKLHRIDAVLGKADDDLDAATGDAPANGTVKAWYWNADDEEFAATTFEFAGVNIHPRKLKAGRLYKWLAVGELFMAVELASRAWAGTIAGSVGAGGSIAVVLSDGTEGTATNVSGQELEAGAVLVTEDAYSGELLISGAAPGGRKFWKCDLVDEIGPGATGTIKLSDLTIGTGGDVEATNVSNSDPGMQGARGFAWKDIDDNYYFVADSLRWFLAELDADLESSDLTAPVTNVVCISGGSVPAGLTDVDNQFGDSGVEGDRCLIVESPNAGSEKYCLVRVYGNQNISRRYKATLSAALLSGSSSASVDNVEALDGRDAPSITTVQNRHHYSGQDNAPCMIEEDWSSVTEGVPAYILYAMDHITATFVTDYRYDTSSHKLQKKTRKVTVMYEEAESDWTDVQAFTGYQTVSDVDFSTPNARKKTRTLFVPEAGTESDWSNFLSFEQITVATEVTYTDPTESYKNRTAYVIGPGAVSSNITVWSGNDCEEEE